MSNDVAFETGRLLAPLVTLANRNKYAGLYRVIMSMPGLRSLFLMSNTEGTGEAIDLVQGLGLRLQRSGSPVYGWSNIPYVAFGGSDYLYRPDSSVNDLTGSETFVESAVQGFTIGGWFYHSDITGYQTLVAKYGDSGQFSYRLHKRGDNDKLQFTVSNDGAAIVAATGDPVSSGTWYWAVGRFNPGSGIDLLQDNQTFTNSLGYTSVYNSTAQFTIGVTGSSTPSLFLKGRASLVFLAAAKVSDDILSYIRDGYRQIIDGEVI